MNKIYIIVFICCLVLSSCGCGPTFLYNWRPKPWIHPHVADTHTGLDTLLNIDGYYVSLITDTLRSKESSTLDTDLDSSALVLKQRYLSVLFYDNGLCSSLNTREAFSDATVMKSTLDTLYSNQSFENVYYKEYNTSWGTYEVHNDTIKAYFIENLLGCDATRKNIVANTYLISDDRKLKQIYASNSNKFYGYTKTLDIPYATFYSIANKRDSTECPYLTKKWFYKKDKVK